MLTTRRAALTGILAAPALLLSSRVTWSHDLFEGKQLGKAPGDEGYMHGDYHEFYQKLFANSGHCSCGTGECRATIWRETRLESPKGYDVVVNRRWRALPAEAWIPEDKSIVPKELFLEPAHVCAYGDENGLTISCALINVSHT